MVVQSLGWERGHVEVGYFIFNRYLCDLFTHDIFQPQDCSRGTFGGVIRGDVCLNWQGLKPVSGHRDTGAVNRARNRSKAKLSGPADANYILYLRRSDSRSVCVYIFANYFPP